VFTVVSAAGAGFEYRVVFAPAAQLERQLDEQGRDGFACVSVARPEPGSGLPGIVAIVARATDAAGRPAVVHRVVAGGRGEMKAPLTIAGGDGFRLCGAVLDEEPPARDVVVMSRPAPGSWQYDAEVLLRCKDSLARLNAIGRDGFVPVAAAPIDNNRIPELRTWMVFAERPMTGSTPQEVAVRSDPGPTGLAKNLNESGKQGFRVALTWKEGNDFVAMMTRSGGSATARTYGVEADAPSRLHFLPGLALADFPYLDRRLFVADAGVRASNELVEETLPPLGPRGVVDARGRGTLVTIGDHLSRNPGYETSYARVARDRPGRFVLSVVMAKRD